MDIKHIFREYDIRGVYKKDLNEKSIKAIGYLLGKKIKSIGKNVAIGYDARTHSVEISKWLISGLNYAGLNVYNMSLVPTPCNYFAGFSDESINATIMITGSHNPPEYNGLKITIDKLPFFGEDITKLSEEVSAEIDTLQISDNITSTQINVLDKYVKYLVDAFKHLKNSKESYVIDCGNGAAGEAVRKICDGLNLNVEIMYEEPDGTFPNHHPDPSDVENLKDVQKMLETDRFKLGFAFDGDGDRLGTLTKNHIYKGDEMALLYSKLMKNPQILGEVKCSQMMYDEIDKIGKSYMYKTGHSNLKMKMREIDIDLAVEVSGHLFFHDRYFGYDDAIYAMLRAMELVHEGIDFDKEITKFPKLYSTDELKIETTDAQKFKTIQKVKEFLSNPPEDFPTIKDIIDVDGVRVIFENGWGLVRASNTTPTLVARFEATDEKSMLLYKQKLENVVKMSS